MIRSQERILTTHVGSLPRDDVLTEVRAYASKCFLPDKIPARVETNNPRVGGARSRARGSPYRDEPVVVREVHARKPVRAQAPESELPMNLALSIDTKKPGVLASCSEGVCACGEEPAAIGQWLKATEHRFVERPPIGLLPHEIPRRVQFHEP